MANVGILEHFREIRPVALDFLSPKRSEAAQDRDIGTASAIIQVRRRFGRLLGKVSGVRLATDA